MPKVLVRRANFEDLHHLTDIAEHSPFQPTDDTGLVSLETHVREGRVLLAHSGGEVAGDLLFRPHLWDEMEPYVEHVDVLPGFKGRGIGRTLMAGLERIAIQNGHAVIYSSTGEDNAASQAFHKALGFGVDCAYPLRSQPSRELMLSKLVIPPITVPQDSEFLL